MFSEWRRVLAVLILTLAGLGMSAGMSRGSATWSNLVIVGWDGVQRAHLDEAWGRGDLPVLANLASTGARYDLITADHSRTVTNPGFVSYLAGISPFDNSNMGNGDRTRLPDGWTLYERLQARLPGARIGWVTAKKHTRVVSAEFLYNLRDNIYGYPDPPYYKEAKRNEDIAAAGLNIINTHNFSNPLLLFVHFAQTDGSGHGCGENSRIYDDALVVSPTHPPGDPYEACTRVPPRPPKFLYGVDYLTGQLIQGLKNRGVWGNTLFVVVADHGFFEGRYKHGWDTVSDWPDSQPVWAVSNAPDLPLRSASMTEVPNAILRAFGFAQDILLTDCNAAFEDPLTPCWQSAQSNGGSVSLVDTPVFSWRSALQTRSPNKGDAAYITQVLDPLPQGTPAVFEVIAYLRPGEYGPTGSGQDLLVQGPDLGTGGRVTVLRVAFRTTGIAVRAYGDVERVLTTTPVPVDAWAKVRVQITAGPTGFSADVRVKWEPLDSPFALSVASSQPVGLDRVRIGDTDDTRGPKETGGVFTWDDVRTYNVLTPNDSWKVEWDMRMRGILMPDDPEDEDDFPHAAGQ